MRSPCDDAPAVVNALAHTAVGDSPSAGSLPRRTTPLAPRRVRVPAEGVRALRLANAAAPGAALEPVLRV